MIPLDVLPHLTMLLTSLEKDPSPCLSKLTFFFHSSQSPLTSTSDGPLGQRNGTETDMFDVDEKLEAKLTIRKWGTGECASTEFSVHNYRAQTSLSVLHTSQRYDGTTRDINRSHDKRRNLAWSQLRYICFLSLRLRSIRRSTANCRVWKALSVSSESLLYSSPGPGEGVALKIVINSSGVKKYTRECCISAYAL